MVNETISNNGFMQQSFELLTRIFQPLLTNFAISVLILLVGLIMGRIMGKLVQRLLHEAEMNSAFARLFGIKARLEEIIGSGIAFIIYALAIILALGHLGLERYVLYLVLVVVLLIILLSFFFGIRDSLSNIIAGFTVRRKGFIHEGEHVNIGDVHGAVEKMTLIDIQVRKANGDIIFFPNTFVVRSTVVKQKK